MTTLRYNLESGDSYLTQHSENPEVEGSILADNFEAVAERIFGDTYTDQDMEYILTVCRSAPELFYEEGVDVEELAKLVDGYAKASGGKGWL